MELRSLFIGILYNDNETTLFNYLLVVCTMTEYVANFLDIGPFTDETT